MNGNCRKRIQTILRCRYYRRENHGLYIEIIDSMAFGMIHISTLDDDFYHVDPDGQSVVGRRSDCRTYSVGDTVPVQVERVDRFKRQIDFRIKAENINPKNPKKAHLGKKKPATAKSAKSAKELTKLRKQRRSERGRKNAKGKK